MKEVYVQIARDLGSIEDSEKRQRFYVGSGLNLTELKRHEYDVWRSVRTMNGIHTWRESIAKKVRFITNDTMDTIEARLLELNVIHRLDFNSVDDLMLKNLFVIRNGYAWGQRGNFWIMCTQDRSRKFNLTSQEEYDLWIEASSYRNLYSMVITISKKYKLSREKSLDLVVKATRDFVRAGVWTIEFVEGGVD